jgi:hypothetical protein
MRHRSCCFAILAAVLGASNARAQVPLEHGPLTPPAAIGAALRDSLQAKAGRYPFVGFLMFGRDSALLVFEDSAYHADAVREGKWMFGPPVTAAEADSCPPEKVLGRKIARVLWRGLDRPTSLQNVMIAVRGSQGIDKWSSTRMYFYPSQLTGRWAGDPGSK